MPLHFKVRNFYCVGWKFPLTLSFDMSATDIVCSVKYTTRRDGAKYTLGTCKGPTYEYGPISSSLNTTFYFQSHCHVNAMTRSKIEVVVEVREVQLGKPASLIGTLTIGSNSWNPHVVHLWQDAGTEGLLTSTRQKTACDHSPQNFRWLRLDTCPHLPPFRSLQK